MKTIAPSTPTSKAHLDIVQTYTSPFFLGAPMSDELVALVQHMFTEEEAEVVAHLRPWLPRSAPWLAAKAGRPLEEVKAILKPLAHEKYLIAAYGQGEKERFAIMPLMPGIFENVLIGASPDNITPWERKFAGLFDDLESTGYMTEYSSRPVNAVRYLPVHESIETSSMAFPSDRLEEVLDRYDDFAIGVCQCRLSKSLTGGGCGRLLETCTVMGSVVPLLVEQGRLTRAGRKDVLETKKEAEKQGLVTWMINEESGKYSNASCSCCGCCCGALRTVSEFNTPGLIAPPHFMPRMDTKKCTACGKCVDACPMKAFELLGEKKQQHLVHKRERCIGCGICAVTCPKASLSMNPVSGYRKPPAGYPSYLARYLPNYFINVFKVWTSRRG